MRKKEREKKNESHSDKSAHSKYQPHKREDILDVPSLFVTIIEITFRMLTHYVENIHYVFAYRIQTAIISHTCSENE